MSETNWTANWLRRARITDDPVGEVIANMRRDPDVPPSAVGSGAAVSWPGSRQKVTRCLISGARGYHGDGGASGTAYFRFRDAVSAVGCDAGTIERQRPGQYDLAAVRKAAFEQLRATASARGSSVKLSDERAALARAQRLLAEVKSGQLSGRLVEIERVGEELENRYATVRELLM
jgi:hypothetical protein